MAIIKATVGIASSTSGPNQDILAPDTKNIRQPTINIKTPVEKSFCRKIVMTKMNSPMSG